MNHHSRHQRYRKPDPAARAAAVADREVCDRPPSQFWDEWLRVYKQALREFASERKLELESRR
jgi:hypothetical protein